MKNIFFLMAISLLFALTSCDNENNEPKSYWQSSDLKKLQLKGKVKTISGSGIYGVYEFDNKGRVSKYSYAPMWLNDKSSLTDEKKEKGSIFTPVINSRSRAARDLAPTGEYEIVETYKYDSSGQLIAIETNGSDFKTLMSYEYGKHGAYVPYTTANIITAYDFKKNLSKGRYTYSPNSYDSDSIVVSGNTMTIYSYGSFKNHDEDQAIIYKDTTHITLNSAKYPAKIEYDKDNIAEFSYYDNNMLKEIKRSYGTRTFLKDDDYLLIEKAVYDNGPTITYIYNEKKDLIKEVSQYWTTEYIYTADSYDENGNWIKRIINGSDYIHEETRVITYY